MPRSSRSVSLALLGSAAFLAACSRPREEQPSPSLEGADWGVANYQDPSEHDEWGTQDGASGSGHNSGYGYGRRPIFIPVPIGGGGGYRGGVGPGPGNGNGNGGNPGAGGVTSSPGGTSRGGFGSTGHSASS